MPPALLEEFGESCSAPWDALPEAANSPEHGAGDGAGGNSPPNPDPALLFRIFQGRKEFIIAYVNSESSIAGAGLYHVALK